MPNKFPLWKNIIILMVVAFAFIYAAPNLYPPDPALQLSGQSSAMKIDQVVLAKVEKALAEAQIEYFAGEADGETALIRLVDSELQMRAKEVVQAEMGGEYIVALNLAPTTPQWLSDLGGSPMKLGLDLSGGVHFLLEVDLDSALAIRLEGDLQEVKTSLREEKSDTVVLSLKDSKLLAVFAMNSKLSRRSIRFGLTFAIFS